MSTLLAAGSLVAQAISPALVGTWRADVPLPNGVVQTFRFDSAGSFALAMTLVVDGTYSAHGNQLVETVALPNGSPAHTDSSTFAITADSLTVDERAGQPARVLHRAHSGEAAGIVGDWIIAVAGGMTAHYTFAPDGSMHIRAEVGGETGKYTVSGDTLHLSNDRTFQLPATAKFNVAGSVLTLTPLNGKSARQFHRVAAN